jgi:hypothetical protein
MHQGEHEPSCLAEYAKEVYVHEVTRRLRDQRLSAMAHRGYPGRTMDVHAHITILCKKGLAGVQANTDADRPVAEGTVRSSGGGERAAPP